MRHLYLPLADSAFIYDNSDGSGALIAERQGVVPLTIHDSDRWNRIEEATR
jgi:predicted ABC-type ATPase